MKEIILTQGYKTQVDDEDYDWLNQWSWYARKDTHNVYAVRNGSGKRHQYTIRMHTAILYKNKQIITENMQPDHIDRNSLNNQKYNLRIVTKNIQMINRRLFSNNTTGIRGVSYNRQLKRWYARFSFNNIQENKSFYSKEEAIIARRKMEIKYLGAPIDL